MACSKCGFENPDGMKFCGGCGAAMGRRCASCGAESPPAFKFCGQCGGSFESDPGIAVREPARPTEEAAERRQLTVMFCDLADFTLISDVLDPEELRTVVRGCQTAAEEVIERFGGHIAQYLGDGLLVYFGYPQAHEDDARRAVHAGLRITKVVDALSGRYDLEGHRLTVRIGIHTGLVVTGEIGGAQRKEHLAMGKTPNIAARLEALADPGTVVISAATHRLVEGGFDFEPRGAHRLKGIAEPVEVYRVDDENQERSTFEVMSASAQKTLVGRHGDLDQMINLWTRAKQGQGQVVVLAGEAGVGKSHLLQVFLDRVAPERHVRIVGRCQAYYENSSLSPIIDLLRQVFRLQRDESPDKHFARLVAGLEECGLLPAEVAPLFADLLEVPLGAEFSAPDVPPQRQRQLTLEAVVRLVDAMAAQRPVLFVIEDVHWVDPSTLELLGMLVDQGPTLPMLTLLTCRPAFSQPWGTRAHLTQLTLGRMSSEEVASIVDAVTAGRGLPTEVLEQVVKKTDGVPLFVEELVKTILEQGVVTEEDGRYVLAGPLTPFAIPATLRDSLTARLDKLTAVKEIAQLGAILGREFVYELLRAVSPWEEGSLQSGLGQLVSAELLYQRGMLPHSTYIFKHAMIQDTAAESLLKSRRQQFHQRAAETMAELFPDIAESHPERLAHHFTEAGMGGDAVGWWLRAAQRAKDRSANAEAIAHAERAVETLATQEETSEAIAYELGAQMVLGSCYSATRGYGAAEVERAFARAIALCSKMGDAPERFPVLWGQWAFYLVRADFTRAPGTASELMHLADAADDPLLQLEARFSVGCTHYFAGQPQAALDNLEAALALDDLERSSPLEFTILSTQDAGVCALVFAAVALWMLGRPDEALVRSRQAVALARRIAHQFSLAYALNFSAWLRFMVANTDEAREVAGEAIDVSKKNGFFWVTLSEVIAGWAAARNGNARAGLEQAVRGLGTYHSFGCLLSQTLQWAITVELLAGVGDVDEGLRRVDEALTAVTQTRERFWLAELHRLRGELLLQQDAGADFVQASEREFRTALEIEDILFRPPGRPSCKPVVRYKSFRYQAKSWTTPRRIVAKVEHHRGELFPRVGFIVTNMVLPSRSVVRFYNKRGTAEPWIKEGKQAAHWTRLSCHRFRANEVRLQLRVLAHNLGSLWRRLVLPPPIKRWSLTSLQQRLVKTGGRLVKHARYYWLLLADGHLTRRLFGDMLRRIWALPVPAR